MKEPKIVAQLRKSGPVRACLACDTHRYGRGTTGTLVFSGHILLRLDGGGEVSLSIRHQEAIHCPTLGIIRL